MVSKGELLYRNAEETKRWVNRIFVVGSIFAGTVLFMAVAGSTMTPKPYVSNGAVDISAASPAHPDTPFALMSRAPANLPVESWEPAF
jgi:hypothetical protein